MRLRNTGKSESSPRHVSAPHPPDTIVTDEHLAARLQHVGHHTPEGEGGVRLLLRTVQGCTFSTKMICFCRSHIFFLIMRNIPLFLFDIEDLFLENEDLIVNSKS